MKQAVIDLETDITDLQEAIDIVNLQTSNISDVLDDVIEGFDGISESFDAEINELVKSADDRESIGADAQNTSDIETIYFGASTQANVKSRQATALTTLASIGDGVREMTDWTRAMDILVTETDITITANRPLLDAFTTLSYVFGFLSASVQSHASNVVTFDNILCVTATNLILTEQYYRTFPLDSLRTQCRNNSEELVLDSAYVASHQERAMTVLITEYANKGDDVQTIASSMQTFFDTDPLLSKASISGPNVIEVLCAIAEAFPAETTYDFFDLAFFRQPCSQITIEQFWIQEDLALDAEREYIIGQRG